MIIQKGYVTILVEKIKEYQGGSLYELRHEKTGFLHMQKQRRRSASR